MMRGWWFWHLLYDNPICGRWLWQWVRRRQWEREFGAATHGIFGLNYRWQQEQRRYIIAEGDSFQLVSPRSRI